MEISYKPSKEADVKVVNVDFNLNDVSEAGRLALAEDAAIVRIQARLRMHDAKIADGKEDKLPTDWVKFVEPRARKTAAEKMKEAISGLSDAEKADLLKMLKAK